MGDLQLALPPLRLISAASLSSLFCFFLLLFHDQWWYLHDVFSTYLLPSHIRAACVVVSGPSADQKKHPNVGEEKAEMVLL